MSVMRTNFNNGLNRLDGVDVGYFESRVNKFLTIEFVRSQLYASMNDVRKSHVVEMSPDVYRKWVWVGGDRRFICGVRIKVNCKADRSYMLIDRVNVIDVDKTFYTDDGSIPAEELVKWAEEVIDEQLYKFGYSEKELTWIMGADVWNYLKAKYSDQYRAAVDGGMKNDKFLDIDVEIMNNRRYIGLTLNKIKLLPSKHVNCLCNPNAISRLFDKEKWIKNIKENLEAANKARKEKEGMRIEKVIFNDPATIVIWKDGTKTVVKAQEGEIFDPEKGLAMAISKKALGNQGNYFEEFKKWLPEKEETQKSDEDNVLKKIKEEFMFDNRCCGKCEYQGVNQLGKPCVNCLPSNYRINFTPKKD